MAEYIEREALMEQVKAIHRAVNTADRNISYDTGFHSATSQIQGLIEWMPAADVAEVRRGKWKIKTDEYDCEYMMCSVCKEEFYPTDTDTVDTMLNFCPYCGADMRGNKNDNRTEN